MQTSPPLDNTHNSGESEVKSSHPVDNTHNSTKPDVEMQDKKVCFFMYIYSAHMHCHALILYTNDIFRVIYFV